MTTRLHLISPWRTFVQGGAFLLWFGLPFARPHGTGLFRIDFDRLQLELAGEILPLYDLFPLLLLGLVLLVAFLLATMALGRVWCGWGCPQSAIVDLIEGCARRIGIVIDQGTIAARGYRKLLFHGICLALSLTVGLSLLWYFIPPLELLPQLVAGKLGKGWLILWGVTSALVYLDLSLLRRLFCREICPYGRLQASLVDSGTLTLRFHPDEAPRCIGCNSCVQVCPTGIDIRNGEQIECIDCGRCLDACRTTMAARGEEGIIRYTFGLGNQGWRALINGRTILLTAILIAATITLTAVVATRAPATMKLTRTAAPPKELGDGRFAVFYAAYLQNRTADRIELSLAALGSRNREALPLRGGVDAIDLAPNERRKVDFAVVFDDNLPTGTPITIELRDRDRTPVAATETESPKLTPHPARSGR